jgi:hypothetical protein
MQAEKINLPLRDYWNGKHFELCSKCLMWNKMAYFLSRGEKIGIKIRQEKFEFFYIVCKES